MFNNYLRSIMIAMSCLLGWESLASAQNSSLFQRPVALVARNNNEPRSEVLPPPAQARIGNEVAINGSVVANGNMNPGMPLPPGFVPQIDPNSALMGMQASWTYVPPVATRSLKIHDIVQIRVEESSTALAQGNATSRKTSSYDAVFKDWIRLVGLDTLKPAPQSDGDPRLQTTESEVYRGDL